MLDLIAALATLTAALAYLNARVLRMPAAIGITLSGLVISLIITGLASLGWQPATQAAQQVGALPFDQLLFQAALPLLLFAGALEVDTHALWRVRWPVLSFALISTALSVALIGGGLHLASVAVGMPITLASALLFGALISPTDPVAVIGILKQARVPERIKTLVTGESLLNDGVAIVAFTVLAAHVGSGHAAARSAGDVATLFIREALGGALLGACIGAAGLLAIRQLKDFSSEVLISLAAVLALVALAGHLHVSAPLAAVAAGLLIGSVTDLRPGVLTDHERFEGFWHLIDELLNVALFALMALTLVSVQFGARSLITGLLAIPVMLGARVASVQAAVWISRKRFEPYTRRLMVWGGLRGAISVALAFSLPPSPEREVLLGAAYVAVVFSVAVQGLTTPALARRAARNGQSDQQGDQQSDQQSDQQGDQQGDQQAPPL